MSAFNALCDCDRDLVFLIIDEDSIDNGNPPNDFSESDVNDDIAEKGLRTQLRFFAANVGNTITLYTGTVGNEGWFAPTTIPTSWDAAGPTADGLRNYLGNPSQAFPHNVGPGLAEALLEDVPDIVPLRATALKLLEAKTVCAVSLGEDDGVETNYGPLTGSIDEDNLGTVAFEVIEVTELTGFGSGALPQVRIKILDAELVCEASLRLFTEAPVPTSSSVPFDTVP